VINRDAGEKGGQMKVLVYRQLHMLTAMLSRLYPQKDNHAFNFFKDWNRDTISVLYTSKMRLFQEVQYSAKFRLRLNTTISFCVFVFLIVISYNCFIIESIKMYS